MVQMAESSTKRRWYSEMDVAYSWSPSLVDIKKQLDGSRHQDQELVEPPRWDYDALTRDAAPVQSRLGLNRKVRHTIEAWR